MENFHTKDMMHITDVTLMVSNIETSLKFYQEVLGLKLIKHNANQYQLGTHKDKVLLNLISNPLATPKMRTTGLYHFAILLPTRVHLGQFIKHIIATKTQITGGADHGISEALYLDDPDGNGIEIYADRIQSEWPAFDEVINAPMNYQDLVLNAPIRSFTKIPDDAIMGHIHLHVANMDTARQFFIHTLGFESTMAYGPNAAFVSDLGYHHHIGFNVWNGQNIPNTPENATGLKAYSLYVPLSRYDALLGRLKANNTALNKDDDKVFIYDVNGVKVYLSTTF